MDTEGGGPVFRLDPAVLDLCLKRLEQAVGQPEEQDPRHGERGLPGKGQRKAAAAAVPPKSQKE